MKMGPVPSQWAQTQRELSRKVLVRPFAGLPRRVAGVDIAYSGDGERARAAGVVWDVQEKRVCEQQVITRPVKYPYVPNFLSFREGPILQELIERFREAWDVIMFDGQGVAHPRRCGLAAHLGVLLDRPSIGAAKSCLCGEYEEPGMRLGDFSPLTLEGEQVGIALRTRPRVKPMYISVGHRVDLESARRIVLACCRFRMPEPTRQADILTKQW